MRPHARLSLALCCALLLTILSSTLSGHAGAQNTTERPALTEEQKQLVAKAEAAVRASNSAVESAEFSRRLAVNRAQRLVKLASPKSADEVALGEFEALAELLGEVNEDGILVAQEENPITGRLRETKTALTEAKAALPQQGEQPEEITRAKSQLDSALTRVEKQLDAVGKARTQLAQALGKVYDGGGRYVELLNERLNEAALPSGDGGGDTVPKELARGMNTLRQVERSRRRFREAWGRLSSALKELPAGHDEAREEAVGKALSALDERINGTLRHLGAWMAKLGVEAETKSNDLAKLVPEVRANPGEKGSLAAEKAREASELSARLTEVATAWSQTEAQLRGVELPGDDKGFDLSDTADKARLLASALRLLGVSVADLQGALAGDFSKFEADQVSLFYFTDVPRLMQILNPATYEVGGLRDAADAAAAERRKLNEADSDLLEARGNVGDLQTTLQGLREELRHSREASSVADRLFRSSDLELQEARRDKTLADQRYERAAQDYRDHPDDSGKRDEAERAARARDRDAQRVQTAERRHDEVSEERRAANERYATARDEQRGLPAKIKEIEDRLAAAASARNRQQRAVALAAQAEAEAFIRARDNRPFWFAPANASSTDPARRVLMWAFNDSKTIFLRGNPRDLDRVKDMIARIDSPAPQARMTLWTLELSSDASNSGTKKFNKALEIIEEDLSDARARTAAALSLLRDCVNETVNRHAFQQSAATSRTGSRADDFRLARYAFYQKEVLIRLGHNPDQRPAADNADVVTRLVIPDPAGTTTLGEALMVLSLGKRQYREEAFNLFLKRLPTVLAGLKPGEDDDDDDDDGVPTKWFPSLRRVLGLDITLGDAAHRNDYLSSSQIEILSALEQTGYQRVLDHVAERAEALRRLDEARLEPNANRQLLDKERENIIKELAPYLRWIRNQSGAPGAADTTTEHDTAKIQDTATEFSRFVSKWRGVNPLRRANARVAAADQMLKEMIISVEDDIDRQFVQPMLRDLRARLRSAGIGVGVVQRTSVLATNRLLARVDPRASAQLTLGQETDVLAATQQLAQLYAAAQTGGVLGTLGALKSLPREQEGELYGLTSGNVFQVTPIFDPSGQALRFRFDHVGSTQIREPDGTVNPQLARIERHTVNTEVQISNMELREVSRFESNARLGIATKYTGGVPIFKDLPGVRYVPLFGWFTRRSGKAAVTQQSLIFGQTTLYPTIGDILDLLTSPVSRVE